MFNTSPIGVHTSLVRKDIDGKDEEAATTLWCWCCCGCKYVALKLVVLWLRVYEETDCCVFGLSGEVGSVYFLLNTLFSIMTLISLIFTYIVFLNLNGFSTIVYSLCFS